MVLDIVLLVIAYVGVGILPVFSAMDFIMIYRPKAYEKISGYHWIAAYLVWPLIVVFFVCKTLYAVIEFMCVLVYGE
jgi:hypothetical protein